MLLLRCIHSPNPTLPRGLSGSQGESDLVQRWVNDHRIIGEWLLTMLCCCSQDDWRRMTQTMDMDRDRDTRQIIIITTTRLRDVVVPPCLPMLSKYKSCKLCSSAPLGPCLVLSCLPAIYLHKRDGNYRHLKINSLSFILRISTTQEDFFVLPRHVASCSRRLRRCLPNYYYYQLSLRGTPHTANHHITSTHSALPSPPAYLS